MLSIVTRHDISNFFLFILLQILDFISYAPNFDLLNFSIKTGNNHNQPIISQMFILSKVAGKGGINSE